MCEYARVTSRPYASADPAATHFSEAIARASSAMWFPGKKRLLITFTHSPHEVGARYLFVPPVTGGLRAVPPFSTLAFLRVDAVGYPLRF